jgi:glutaminase
MYDSAGEWIYKVGMPAKSGVAGGILAVLPGQLVIGVFSPPLDQHGNSVRGIGVCEELSRMFNLHLFNAPVVAKAVIRSRYDAAQINSRRLRPPQVARLLQQQGDRLRVYELQGDLIFSTVEVVIRDILASGNSVVFVILDLKRVTSIDTIACHLLRQLLHTMAAQQRTLLFSHVDRTSPFASYILGQVGPDTHPGPLLYADHDLALEWCEDQLLAQVLDVRQADTVLPLPEHQLCQGLSERDLHHLQSLLKPLTFHAGERIIQAGAAPDQVYLLVKGEVSVSIRLPTGRRKRLSTLSAGMTFGEMALIERSPRSADVTASTPVECYALSLDEFDHLEQVNPTLRATLLTNLLRHVSHLLRRLTQEVAVLAG